MSIASQLSGLFFLLIIITNISSGIFGYKTIDELDSKSKLIQIGNNPKKFKIGFVLIIIEHFCIILVVTSLFIAFNSYNLLLGIIWVISRIAEGLIQIYNKKNYWRLLELSESYLNNNESEKNECINEGKNILNSKKLNFSFSQILFSIGTFSYSILFAIYNILPATIAWFGVVSSIIYGSGNVLSHKNPKLRSIWNIGGLFILIYEILLSIWLLFGL